MQIDSETIRKRLAMVDGTHGGVVAVATWCLIHAGAASAIVMEWASCIHSPTATSASTTTTAATTTEEPAAVIQARRINLLMLMNEMIVSVQQPGVSDVARRDFLAAIVKGCPGALVRAVKQPDPNKHFAKNLDRILRWWSNVRVFPPAWIIQIRNDAFGEAGVNFDDSANQGPGGGGAGGQGSSGGAGVPQELVPLVRLFAKFKSAKEKHYILQQQPDADPKTVDSAKNDVIRRLTAILKAVDGREKPDEFINEPCMVSILRSDLRTLRGEAEEQPDKSKDGDLLGSFFD